MPSLTDRNPESVPGDWYIDNHCIDCAASRVVAPGLIIHRNEKSIFARQPETEEEIRAAWRAALVCPTASIGRVSRGKPPPDLFPYELASGVFLCGYNARSSFGANSYLAKRTDGNLLIDSPRYSSKLVKTIKEAGGLDHILLTHRDDVADADRYAKEFGAKVWIHQFDADAAPYATDVIEGEDAAPLTPGVIAIPVPGHTRGSVVYLIDDTYLFNRRLPCLGSAPTGFDGLS